MQRSFPTKERCPPFFQLSLPSPPSEYYFSSLAIFRLPEEQPGEISPSFCNSHGRIRSFSPPPSGKAVHGVAIDFFFVFSFCPPVLERTLWSWYPLPFLDDEFPFYGTFFRPVSTPLFLKLACPEERGLFTLNVQSRPFFLPLGRPRIILLPRRK